jgi:glycosyltransferase involved in cell wall biosynthesis
MTLYGLHAHEVDPRKATGIARYARALAIALTDRVDEGESVTLVTARGCGVIDGRQDVLDRRRRSLYLAWLATRRPLLESLVPGLDLLHVTAPIVPIGTAKPLVVTVHDITPITHPEWYTARAALLFRETIRWTRKHADAVVVPSQYVATQVSSEIGIDPSRVFVTGYGFDEDHFAHDAPDALASLGLDSSPYLIYLGAVTSRKNLVTLIEALPEDGPQLVIAGPEAVGAEGVHEAAESRGTRVRFLGRVPDTHVGSLLRGALALVHPSSFEGFGLTVLEAMGLGTPVIVSSEGSLPEVAGPAGHVVSSNDVAGWREALHVTGDPAALQRLREAGLDWAAGWTWNATADKTLAVYRHVLGGARR